MLPHSGVSVAARPGVGEDRDGHGAGLPGAGVDQQQFLLHPDGPHGHQPGAGVD